MTTRWKFKTLFGYGSVSYHQDTGPAVRMTKLNAIVPMKNSGIRAAQKNGSGVTAFRSEHGNYPTRQESETMYKSDGVLLLSPSDLLASTTCAHLLRLETLKAEGAIAPPVSESAQAETID